MTTAAGFAVIVDPRLPDAADQVEEDLGPRAVRKLRAAAAAGWSHGLGRVLVIVAAPVAGGTVFAAAFDPHLALDRALGAGFAAALAGTSINKDRFVAWRLAVGAPYDRQIRARLQEMAVEQGGALH